MELQRRMLYTPIFHIDTNMINAYGKLPAMIKLEKWAAGGVIRINMSNVSFFEAKQGINAERTKKTLAQIFTLEDDSINESSSTYQMVANALFPGGAQNENQKNDIKIVCDAIKWNAILVTNDGGSKRQPGGILGNAHKLKNYVQIMRDHEAVAFINKEIEERDNRNRKISKITGKALPKWTGQDNA